MVVDDVEGSTVGRGARSKRVCWLLCRGVTGRVWTERCTTWYLDRVGREGGGGGLAYVRSELIISKVEVRFHRFGGGDIDMVYSKGEKKVEA